MGILAVAAISTNLVLHAIGDFLQRAGIETSLPVTEEMLVRTRVVPEDDIFATDVFGRYYVLVSKSRVRLMIDHEEHVGPIMSRSDPDKMVALSKIRCVIDEEQAREIACEIFEKLGFQESRFDPPEVNRFWHQPNELDPNVRLYLPWFHIRWSVRGAGKGPMDACIKMIISGRTKKMIYYSITALRWANDSEFFREP